MRTFIKRYLSGLGLFLAVIFVAANITLISSHPKLAVKLKLNKQTATVLDLVNTNSAKPAYGYAWNDNVGWINFGTSVATGTANNVYVSNNKLYGYAWGENIGWISFNCENDNTCANVNYSVTQNESNGILTGYAWGENIGWISFNCSNTNSCGTSNYAVNITTNTAGVNTFSGYAWGENIGWVSFSDVTSPNKVTTSWLKSDNSSHVVVTNKNCIYDDPAWSQCINGSQTRIKTATNAPCDQQTTVTENQVCTINITATTTATSTVEITATTTSTTTPFIATSTATTTKTGIIIQPKNNTILTGETISFIANITSPEGHVINVNDLVDWSIFPPDPDGLNGTITDTGFYTAPAIATNVTIFAKSKNNITNYDYATVTVRVEYRIVDGFIFKKDQKKGDVSEDVANLQNRLNKEGYYNGFIGGGFGDLTVKSVIDYQKANKLIETGELDALTRAKLNGQQPKEATTTLNDIELSQNTVNAGGSLTIKTNNWLANSLLTITLHSDPVILNTINTDANGSLVTTVDIPADTIPGLHSIKINGTGSDTLPKTISMDITVNPQVNNPVINSDDQNTNNNVSNTGSGSGSSQASTENTPTILNVSGFINNNVAVLGTTTEQIFLAAQKVVESPVGSAVTKTITTAGVVTGGVVATGVFAMNGMVMADLLFLPFKLWTLLLTALGLKKRNRPWGTVYDSVTKQPIDPAYVTFKKLDGTEENMSITDLDGRYGFLVSPGKYILTANKTNYLFPSQKLQGKTDDTLYSNLYLGEELDIQNSEALINKNIPLDPIKFDWNEFVKGEKKMMKFYSKREKMIRIITDWMFRIGLIVSTASLILVSAPYNLIIFGLYVILAILRKFGLGRKALGSIIDKNGDPLSFAVVRVFDSELNVEITNKVADKLGRYFCLVNKGKYYVKIEKKNDDESYSLVYTSPTIDASSGIIKENFTI